jgi:hypothetical protein
VQLYIKTLPIKVCKVAVVRKAVWFERRGKKYRNSDATDLYCFVPFGFGAMVENNRAIFTDKLLTSAVTNNILHNRNKD